MGSLSLYYEVHGSGEPLVLLHGGVGAVEMFGPVLPALAEHRRVLAVDLQAHGRTADIDRPLRFELLADDIAALIGHLAPEGADVMGYSFGGGVACGPPSSIPSWCAGWCWSRRRASATAGTRRSWPVWRRWVRRPPSR
jgi:alpha/beta hydrolase fold